MKRSLALLLAVPVAMTLGCKSNKVDKSAETAAPPPPAASAQYDVVETTTYGATGSGMTGSSSAEVIYVDPQPAPSQPQPATSVAPGAQPGGTYTVKAGDTLWNIAARVYGDGQKYRDILAANPGLNPRKLRVGQQIVLP